MAIQSELAVARALDKRQRLLDELNSDEHYEKTETTYYGEHEPFEVPLVVCDFCNTAPQFGKTGLSQTRWSVTCSTCKKQIQHPQAEPWKAKLLWWQRNLKGHDYCRLPLFELNDLDVPAARRRMASIRRDLEIKRDIASAEELLSRLTDIPPPSAEYRIRLDAYLCWTMLTLALLKQKDGGTQRHKRQEYLASIGQKPGGL